MLPHTNHRPYNRYFCTPILCVFCFNKQLLFNRTFVILIFQITTIATGFQSRDKTFLKYTVLKNQYIRYSPFLVYLPIFRLIRLYVYIVVPIL